MNFNIWDFQLESVFADSFKNNNCNNWLGKFIFKIQILYCKEEGNTTDDFIKKHYLSIFK